ncbi:exo-alpha-sialidase [candidate division KSB1 bacterium]|nr:exo-alpha-sialidase [candidate division KSB1 bacterium]
MNLDLELNRTNPDYVVYIPKSMDGSTHDTGNEHFLVFDGPGNQLMAVWTQSTAEGQPDQRIVFSKSPDQGHHWIAPKVIAGAIPPKEGHMASWGFPMVSESGRLYVIYSRHTGVNDLFTHTSGLMAGIYSDDGGETWSSEQIISMRRSQWDNPDPTFPANWIVWQKPQRVSKGKYFAGFTRWVSPAVRHPSPVDHWTAHESVVEFLRFENIDDHPQPQDIEISWFARDEEALRVGFPGYPEVSVIQEPSIVKLPDGRLFVAMRSPRGNPYFTVSDDGGESWRAPEVMRQYDDGPPLLHPCSPCPIYPISEGRTFFLHHNHDGHFERWGPWDSHYHRRPICIAYGEFRKNAQQPVWFSEPGFLMDNNGVSLGYRGGRADLAMYASVTHRNNELTLWYPDRKFFLLGKRMTPNLWSALAGPPH